MLRLLLSRDATLPSPHGPYMETKLKPAHFKFTGFVMSQKLIPLHIPTYSAYSSSALTIHAKVRSVSAWTAFWNEAQYMAANQNRAHLHRSVLKAQ